MERVEDWAPEMLTPLARGVALRRHWRVGAGDPVAVMLNWAWLPEQMETGEGWPVKPGQTVPLLTVMIPAPETDCWPSGLVMVSVRPPVVAAAAMFTFSVIWVGSVNVMELTVMPVPEKAAWIRFTPGSVS